jgi:hypothetical protein
VALDMQLFVSELWEQRNILVRGLAHPIAFQSFSSTRKRPFDNELRGRTPGLVPTPESSSRFTNNNNMQSLENYGAVQVSQSGQNVLLFPGGVQEAQSGDRTYPLYWPTDKVDFVRTAARFNATIIPVSAIGMPDSFTVPIERQTLLNTPIIGNWIRQQSRNSTRARYDAKPDDDDLLLFTPTLPGIPQRNYFLFGTPIDTTLVNPNNKEECRTVYDMTKNEVRNGIDDLLQARNNDPYKDSIRRFAYERFFQKKAPTFPIDILNKKQKQ